MNRTQKIVELNAFDPLPERRLDSAIEDLIVRRHRVFGPHAPLFYNEPIHLTHGKGPFLYDAQGLQYLDAYNNVACVGHCHPHVVDAIAQQAALLNVNTRYLCEIVYTYAEKLLCTFPPAISNVIFTCTGSESVDLALRIARHYTGAMGMLVTRHAYHGNTTAAAEISPESRTDSPRLHVRTVRSPDLYREPTDDVIGRFTGDILAAVRDLQQHGIQFAGMIVDTIFSSDGIYAQPAGLLAKAIETVHGVRGLFIADEVQPGFGRTGERMWGFQRHGIVPDIVVMGKPMGNGHPLAGVVVKPEILEKFAREAGYFNTFAGNPVSAAAGLAVLEVLEEEGLLANAWETGNYLIAGLKRLGERFGCIGDVRGAGLFVGVELCRGEGDRAPAPDRAAYVVNALRKKCVLIGTTGPHANVLKIRPPLCFSRENADTLLVALEGSLKEG